MPAVVVDGIVVAVFLNTDRVQVAGDRLSEVYFSVYVGLLYGAVQYAALVVEGVGAVLALH